MIGSLRWSACGPEVGPGKGIPSGVDLKLAVAVSWFNSRERCDVCDELGAGADGRPRHRLRPLGLLFLRQPDAGSTVVAGPRDTVDLRMSGLTAFVVKPPSSGHFGTSMGTQDVVYTSSSSPLVHAASGVKPTAVGVVVTASSGAPTTASASTAAETAVERGPSSSPWHESSILCRHAPGTCCEHSALFGAAGSALYGPG